MSKFLKNRRGAALAVTIIIFFILTILGTTVLAISLSENKQVAIQENKMKSYFVARGGADAMASFLISNPAELDGIIQKTKLGPAVGEIDGRDFEIYVTGTEHEFIIESISYSPQGTEESRVYLTMKELNLLDHAIFADQIIDTGNNVTINGDIGTNRASITFGNTLINGNITLGVAATPSDVAEAESNIVPGHLVNTLTVPMVLPSINPADFPTVIENGTIDINTENYTMVDGKLKGTLSNININGNTQFYAHGGGQVHLYISGSISASGTATIGTDSETKLYIYYDKSDTIEFNGSPDSNVTIYAPNATIEYNGGGNSEIFGSFICNTFDGPDSNSIISKGSGDMADLNIEGVAGYHRAIWSD